MRKICKQLTQNAKILFFAEYSAVCDTKDMNKFRAYFFLIIHKTNQQRSYKLHKNIGNFARNIVDFSEHTSVKK